MDTNLQLCLATVTHNAKMVTITHIRLIFRPNICKSICINNRFIPNNCDLKQIRNDYSRA